MNNVKDIPARQPVLNDAAEAALPAELAATATIIPPAGLDLIEDAIHAIAAGRPVLVVDNEDRENEGDIIFAAQHATPALMGWTIRYSSGVICVPLDAGRADALALPPMVEHPRHRQSCPCQQRFKLPGGSLRASGQRQSSPYPHCQSRGHCPRATRVR